MECVQFSISMVGCGYRVHGTVMTKILDDESEGMCIVAHPNENITRHLSEKSAYFPS